MPEDTRGMLLQIKRAFLKQLKSMVLYLRPWVQSIMAETPLPATSPSIFSAAPLTRYVDNLADLDVELNRVKEAFQVSDDAARQAMSQFSYICKQEFPNDPYAEAYRQAQMQLYLTLSKQEVYAATRNERSHFDLERAKFRPFPYHTQSATTTGDQLMAQGFIIRTMGLPPEARIVEFGPGWGNLTLELARLGYRVTAVEIEPDFVALIKHRATQMGQQIDVCQNDMLDFQPAEKFDAALFFESFHHCSDHIRLLKNLSRIVHEDGVIVFASEPITPLPYPWGVRIDGMSLMAIREWGWLELGFDTSYFLRTLLLFGWLPLRIRSDVSPLTDVIVARKSHLVYEPHKLTLPPDEEQTWALRCAEGMFTSRESLLSSMRDAPVKTVEFHVSNYAPKELAVTFNVGNESRTISLAASTQHLSVTLPTSSWNGEIKIISSTWTPKPGTEFALAPELGVLVHTVRLLC